MVGGTFEFYVLLAYRPILIFFSFLIILQYYIIIIKF